MRGFVFILESVFAGLILVGFMLYLSQGYVASGQADETDFGWALPELDHQGLLRGYAYSGDLEGLEGEISTPGYSHSVQFCGPSGACQGERPPEENVHVSSYFLSGNGSFQPMEVRLYAWEA
jgi:hypothetical protein